MAKIYCLGLLVVVVVSTVYPFVFLCQRDQLYLKRWYSSLGTALQCLLYAWARISSYPYVADLQHAVSVSHNTVEAVLVVTLGELTGAMCQGYLFEYALPVYAQSHSYGIKLRGGYSNLCAGNERTWIRQQYLLTRSYIDIKCVMEVGSNLVPRCCSTVIGQLSGVKGSKASRTITSASRRNPALFSALAHCSFVHVLAPYLVAFVVYCLGDSGDLLEGIQGSIVAGLLMFIPIRIASPETAPAWAYKFAYEIAVPSMRACATILMIYRLWCEHQAVSNGMGMPEKTIDYWKFNISPQKQDPRSDRPEVQDSPPLTRARAQNCTTRSRTRLRSDNPLVPSPMRALRFQEGPPKVLAKAANVCFPESHSRVAA